MITIETVNKYLEANGKPINEGYVLGNRVGEPDEFIIDWDVENLEQPTAQDLASYAADIDKAKLKSHVEKYSKSIEYGEIEFNGIIINGDPETRAALNETVAFWQVLDPEEQPVTVDWEGYDMGDPTRNKKAFVAATLQDLITISKAIGFRRQKRFTVKKSVFAAIDAGSIFTMGAAELAVDEGMA